MNQVEETLFALRTQRENIQKIFDSEEKLTNLEWLSLKELQEKLDEEIKKLL